MRRPGLAVSLVIGFGLLTGARALEVDPQIPVYAPAPVGAAIIKSVGSDTMGELMRNWATAFSKLNPDVKFRNRKQRVGDRAGRLGRRGVPTRADVSADAERRV